MSAHACVDPKVHDIAAAIRVEMLRTSDNDYAPGLVTIERIIVMYERTRSK